jgi:hypothetical protein
MKLCCRQNVYEQIFILESGLPDGLFSNQRTLHRLENVTIFYVHLEYFMDIWDILRTFGTFYGHSVHFLLIWYIFHVLVLRTKKNLATLPMISDATSILKPTNDWI